MVVAIPMPHPIYGQITTEGTPIRGLEIIVKNLDTSVEKISTTNNKGFYQVDLGNVDPKYRDDDRIKVSLKYCADLQRCSKSVVVSGGGNKVSWDIAVEQITTPLPKDSVVVKYVCWDGTAVDSKSKCSTKPKVVEKITCPDNTVVDSKSECPAEKKPKPVVVEKIKCADGTVVKTLDDCKKVAGGLLWKIISAALAIFCGIAMAMFYSNRKKYNWIPGMIGIIKKYNDESNDLMKQGKKKEAEKKRKTALKTMNTITKKYLGKK